MGATQALDPDSEVEDASIEESGATSLESPKQRAQIALVSDITGLSLPKMRNMA